MKRIAIIAAALVLAASAAADAAPKRWPASGHPQGYASLRLFGQLKDRVDRHHGRLVAQNDAITQIALSVAYTEACTPGAIDLGLALDQLVAPLYQAAGREWEPLGGRGLYALLVLEECLIPADENLAEKAAMDAPAAVPFVMRMRPR